MHAHRTAAGAAHSRLCIHKHTHKRPACTAYGTVQAMVKEQHTVWFKMSQAHLAVGRVAFCLELPEALAQRTTRVRFVGAAGPCDRTHLGPHNL